MGPHFSCSSPWQKLAVKQESHIQPKSKKFLSFRAKIGTDLFSTLNTEWFAYTSYRRTTKRFQLLNKFVKSKKTPNFEKLISASFVLNFLISPSYLTATLYFVDLFDSSFQVTLSDHTVALQMYIILLVFRPTGYHLFWPLITPIFLKIFEGHCFFLFPFKRLLDWSQHCTI